ncbi:MAG TPA: DinB family protein [Gemmatimonadaceae bacterium]|nr:DinB family protein [Gemmatimonadaceae bacterium]
MTETARVAGPRRASVRRALPSREVLVATLEEAYRGPAWHGPALLVTLRGCTTDEACWRAAPGRNTIWELALHAAYGKHLLRVRLTGERRRFPRALARSWWPVAPKPGTAQWQEDLALLESVHRALVEGVAEASAARLARRRAGRRHTIAEEILGLALHDTYHGGQIALLRKLYESR